MTSQRPTNITTYFDWYKCNYSWGKANLKIKLCLKTIGEFISGKSKSWTPGISLHSQWCSGLPWVSAVQQEGSPGFQLLSQPTLFTLAALRGRASLCAYVAYQTQGQKFPLGPFRWHYLVKTTCAQTGPTGQPCGEGLLGWSTRMAGM